MRSEWMLAGRLRSAIRGATNWGPLGLAVVVGLLAGAGAVALRAMISSVQWLVFDVGANLGVSTGLPIPRQILTIVAPALGMLVGKAERRFFSSRTLLHVSLIER